jgi:hydrogenase small subunit
MGTLAAAVGFSQAEVSKIVGAFAGNSNSLGPNHGKPRVLWIHGAECTGCSTSLLGLLEAPDGNIYGTAYETGAALGLAGVTNALGGAFPTLTGALRADGTNVNIADVVIDVIDLQYHETVMSMGGDLAAQWLQDFRDSGETAVPFVLVVEGALQDAAGGGAWNETNSSVPWCSVGMFDDGSNEQDMPEVVADLAAMANCAAVIPIGQCAAYGGYPGCKPQMNTDQTGAVGSLSRFDTTQSQTGAKGVHQFLTEYTDTDATRQAAVRGAGDKVVAVPGCPTNPWWFVLTVVMFMVDLVNTSRPLGVLTAAGMPNPAAVDYGRRLKAVYPVPVHSPYCPRHKYYTKGVYATKPGDPGCLQKLGCKGIGTNSLCGVHGWNNHQPQNDGPLSTINGGRGGHCLVAGHPCMACTEKGYPDSFVPFVKR